MLSIQYRLTVSKKSPGVLDTFTLKLWHVKVEYKKILVTDSLDCTLKHYHFQIDFFLLNQKKLGESDVFLARFLSQIFRILNIPGI